MKTDYSTRKSLFQTILTSFLVLILIFSLSEMLIFWLVKNHLHAEWGKQNRLTAQKVSERYHLQFQRIKEALYKQATTRNVVDLSLQALTETDAAALETRPVVQELQSLSGDSELGLAYIMLMYRTLSLAIDLNGSGPVDKTVSGTYQSSQYPPAFWQEQFKRKANYVLHPAASFQDTRNKSAARTFIPYSIKPPQSENLVVAFLDADRLREAATAGHAGLRFTLLGPQRQVIDQTGGDWPAPEQWASLLNRTESQETVSADGAFDYVIETDSDGLTYVIAIPLSSFAAESERLDRLMQLLLVVSVLIAFGAAVLFSKRIHRPVRELLSAVTDPRQAGRLADLGELDLIHQKIQALQKEKEEINAELQNQHSVLTSYYYANLLKSINHELHEWSSIQAADQEDNFTVVLYELRFRSVSPIDLPLNREQAAQLIGDYVKKAADGRFPKSHTFQMEPNQFLSVIPGNDRERIVAMLEELKETLDRDRQFCLVIAAVSSWFGHSAQFSYAYQQVREMVLQARLLEEMQIVQEFRISQPAFALTLTEEQELTAALQAGSDQEAVRLAEQWLAALERKEAGIGLYRTLAESIAAKAQKVLEHNKIEASASWRLKPVMLNLKECCTLGEYKETLQTLLRAVTALIRDKKEASDPIIEHVMKMLQERYADELSLDLVAEPLHLTPSYLSSYIKEKTGINFTEHLHDLRLEHAQSLLVGTDANIQDIAVQVGYRNISSFNRMFKSSTGMSPGEYRRSQSSLGQRKAGSD